MIYDIILITILTINLILSVSLSISINKTSKTIDKLIKEEKQ
jgi:hypothetical protein